MRIETLAKSIREGAPLCLLRAWCSICGVVIAVGHKAPAQTPGLSFLWQPKRNAVEVDLQRRMAGRMHSDSGIAESERAFEKEQLKYLRWHFLIKGL